MARTQELVLDHVGVALLGATQPWAAKVRALALADGGAAESTIYGFGRVPARAAALVNGTAAHAVELDDTHDESLNHPGAVVIPAALAVAEKVDADGRALLAAIVAGYETQCRIGIPLGAAVIARGFHPTATCGVFGAAAAAANLLQLDATTVVSAFGSAASMSSGVMQFSEDPSGTMTKRLHGGLPAERGVLAAQLAAGGFAGPRGAIDGRYGFAAAFGGIAEADQLEIDTRLDRFEIERVSIKLHACCKLFHSLLDAIDDCRAELAFDVRDIAALEPFGPQAMLDTHITYRPESTMAAQYSLPYTVAAALLGDTSLPAAFETEARARPAVQQLADLVAPRVDASLEAEFPKRMAGGIRIILSDGREVTRRVLDSRSSPNRPADRAAIERKFRAITTGIIEPGTAQRIIEAVDGLGDGLRARALATELRDAIKGTSSR
jgi:2-methylcitrate dehydratase PrpD